MTPSDDLGISEIHVQDAFASLLLSSVGFRTAFLARVGERAGVNAQFYGATRSIHEQDGETDIQAEWRREDGGRLRVLIEVKLAAQFMPRQGERYQTRAARALAEGNAKRVRTVLLAPRLYFASANVEASRFDVLLALEDIVVWAGAEGAEVALPIRNALIRLANGRPLGAKGLYRNLHASLASESEHRQLQFRITNNATDWVFLDHPVAGKGVRFRYRISSGIAELRLNKSFPGDHALPGILLPTFITRLSKGTETVFRHSQLRVATSARSGDPSQADVSAIVTAFYELAKWWGVREDMGSPQMNAVRK